MPVFPAGLFLFVNPWPLELNDCGGNTSHEGSPVSRCPLPRLAEYALPQLLIPVFFLASMALVAVVTLLDRKAPGINGATFAARTS